MALDRVLSMEEIRNQSWKNDPSYHPPYHWKRKLCAFLGIHLPMVHRFDLRELFVRKSDFGNEFIGMGFNFPGYRQCWRRFWGKE